MDFIKKRLPAIIIIALIIFAGFKTLDYLVVDDSTSYTRLMEHEFYGQDQIDILCLGASHCYRGIIPSILNEKTGKKTFNASSSSQKPDASLALIKDAVKRYDIEVIYLEISAAIAQETGNYKERDSMVSTYLVSDYMPASINKLSFLLNASSSEHYMNSFWRARRYWESIADLSYVRKVVKTKQTDAYKSYSPEFAASKHEWYVSDGFVANDLTVDEQGYYSKDGNKRIKTERVSDDWQNSILEIIEFCNKHDIRLVLYDSPVSNYMLAAQGNYDEYIDFIKDLIKGRDVEFAEFNLLKDEYLPNREHNYKDGHHLNLYGAEQFSEFLSEYINGNIPDDAFYGSVQEKLNDLDPYFYGICYRNHNKKSVRTVRLISNRENYYEYRVELKGENGRTELLQDFDTNSKFEIPYDELKKKGEKKQAAIVVTYREKGSDSKGTRLLYRK